MKHEELLQGYEYQKDIGDIIQCPSCGKWIPWDEFVNSCCMCDECFWEEYANNFDASEA